MKDNKEPSQKNNIRDFNCNLHLCETYSFHSPRVVLCFQLLIQSEKNVCMTKNCHMPTMHFFLGANRDPSKRKFSSLYVGTLMTKC